MTVLDTPEINIPQAILRTVNLTAMVSELQILTKERGLVRFGDVMNYAQRAILTDCERQLATTGQIRIIVLKARQIGTSTVIEAIIFVLSILFRDYHSLIVSHEKDSAEGLLKMTKRYWGTYPFKQFHQEKYNGKQHLEWEDLGSEIQVATAKNVDAGRSKTLQALHASEVAFWDEPETLMTGLRQSIPTYGLTAIFLESTANGVGNYFHRTWNEAAKGDNEYTPHFFPWWKHPEYRAQFIPMEDYGKFAQLEHLDADELALRKKGIADDRLIWRRWAIVNLCQGDLQKFHQEYPASPHEAFISTGRNVFPLPNLVSHYEPRRGKKGILIEVGGKLQFHESPTGFLTVFSYPSKVADWGVYVIGADPTHTTAGDYACAQVINRRTLEQVAVYRRKIDPVNFANDLRRLGYFYNEAMIAPEKTGPGYSTIGALLQSNYPFVWQSQKMDTTPGSLVGDTYGWGTNRQTKHLAIAHLTKAIMDKMENVRGEKYGLVLHDEGTVTELRDYITTEDGQGYTNSDGSLFDDTVMALAIALTVHNIEPPVPAFEGNAQDFSRGPAIEIKELPKQKIKADPQGPTHQVVVGVDHAEERADTAPAWDQWDDDDE